jgi:hypothetical protein
MEKYFTAGQTQTQICRMRIACWIHKAKNTHSKYVTFTAFIQQQWLHERDSALHYRLRTLPVYY